MNIAAVTPAPTITESPQRLVVSRHCVCTQAELKDTLGSAFEALYARIAEAGVATDGPPFVVYNTFAEAESSWDIDVCAPIAEAITPAGDIGFREFPPERVVELLHVGPYETLKASYAEIDRYIADAGLTRTGAPREIYLSEADVPAAQINTLIEQPIR
jgi:effector-binding domain-containing protein